MAGEKLQAPRGTFDVLPADAEVRAIVLAADGKHFSAGADFSFLDELTRMAVETGAEVVLPWDGRDHYLAAVYRTDLAERIDALVAAGERKMSALIDASDAQQIVLPDSRPLTNVNTDSDFRALVQPGA